LLTIVLNYYINEILWYTEIPYVFQMIIDCPTRK